MMKRSALFLQMMKRTKATLKMIQMFRLSVATLDIYAWKDNTHRLHNPETGILFTVPNKEFTPKRYSKICFLIDSLQI
jgi:hypothetical protein